MTTRTASATRTEAPCLRCDGTGRYENYGACYGCNGLGVVHLTPAGLKARTTRARRRPAPPATTARVECGYCEDTGRLVNHGWATGNPCKHC